MAKTSIDSLPTLAQFVSALGSALRNADWPPLLLEGALGCGKTALTSRLCQTLPGGAYAEVASPSFNLCNIYPCCPQVMHCDFYRAYGDIPDEIWNFIDDKQGLLVVEWPQTIRPLLKDFLDISFNVVNHARELEIRASGRGGDALASLKNLWPLK